MKFADLLFSKYASPQILLDGLISNGDFHEWVIEFVNAENERQIWDVWIHKVFDKSFAEFKNSIVENHREIPEEQIETTIRNSHSILNEFIPEERG